MAESTCSSGTNAYLGLPSFRGAGERNGPSLFYSCALCFSKSDVAGGVTMSECEMVQCGVRQVEFRWLAQL